MCIKVTRWFFCHVPFIGPPPQNQQARQDADPFRPWIHWEVNELVPFEELHRRAPGNKGYSRVRHKMEHWIRCARVQATDCKAGPVEHRVELYSIACPDCTQDHPSVMHIPPYHVHNDEWPGLDEYDQVRRITGYYGDLLTIARAFFENELDKEPLQGRQWNVFMRGHNCTQDNSHIRRDHPDRVGHHECLIDCACTVNPGAHNISRAARNQEGQLTRAKHSRHWFLISAQDTYLDEWKTVRFADMPNQLGLNMDPEMQAKHDYMMAQVGEQLTSLSILGVNPDRETSVNTRIEDLEEWRFNLRRRESLCILLLRFAATDPGITMKFADALVRFILTALAPGLDPNLVPQNLACRFDASSHMRWLVAYVDRLYATGSYPKRVTMSIALRNQNELFEVLKRNRLVTFRNIMTRQKTAEGAAARWEVSGATILQTGHEEDRNCSICGDDFDTSADNVVPKHLRTIRPPCCQQFIHFRCFKGLTTSIKQACPFCNQSLALAGMNPRNQGAFGQWNTALEDLPAGLMRFANPLEITRLTMRDGVGTQIVQRLNPVIEAEEHLRPGRLGNYYRDWPMPPSSDESSDDSQPSRDPSSDEDEDVVM
ncbi:hypothetical protein FSARC_4861 [Fusarium sarcochroum]|uniref:RING-type domain-containing protein n=1 Tax=Fusarium sarcochroum TaxID=1208366 RepID=A0A8H4U158_9HYPO|nr:hypothetical protein FSARC_4861 [Fusarium sarcochroum]